MSFPSTISIIVAASGNVSLVDAEEGVSDLHTPLALLLSPIADGVLGCSALSVYTLTSFQI